MPAYGPDAGLKLTCHWKILSSNGAADTPGVGQANTSLWSRKRRRRARRVSSFEVAVARVWYFTKYCKARTWCALGSSIEILWVLSGQ